MCDNDPYKMAHQLKGPITPLIGGEQNFSETYPLEV